jgi:hypothetical protein
MRFFLKNLIILDMPYKTVQIMELNDESSGFPEWFVTNVPEVFLKKYYNEIKKQFPSICKSVKITADCIKWLQENKEGNTFLKMLILKHFTKLGFMEFDTLTLQIVTQFAKEKRLADGSAIKLYDGYRNEGLLFWDGLTGKIIEPFTDIDDYGSVPPRFRVGPDGFAPDSWLSVVDHNGVVFPTPLFMEQIHDAYVASGKKEEFKVNGMDFYVADDIDDWNSFTIHVAKVYPHYTTSYEIYPTEPEFFELDEKRQKILTQSLIRKNARTLLQVGRLNHANVPRIPNNALGRIGEFLTGRKAGNSIKNSVATLKKNHNKKGGAKSETRKTRR